MSTAPVGIIGGTGLGELLRNAAGASSCVVDTPFGPPSTAPIVASWHGAQVAYISRHGEGHRLSPSNVPYRANIWALKALGVRQILATGATGSLREQIEPGHLVLCDQVIDKTFRRSSTFFDEDVVAHVDFADPFCLRLRRMLVQASERIAIQVHHAGTYVCMEGPQFSTRAESNLHRGWGGDLIGMTCMPEAKLAREAEMCYALIALPTDYDCWRPPPPDRTHDDLLKEIRSNLRGASDRAVELIRHALPLIAADCTPCACHDALRMALWTDKGLIKETTRKRLAPILGRYFP